MKQYALLFACLFFLCVGSKAQEQPTRWTLRACLDYALEHNIQVKKSKVSHLSGIEDTKQAKAQLFPSLSASVTQGKGKAVLSPGYPRIRELSFERRRYE